MFKEYVVWGFTFTNSTSVHNGLCHSYRERSVENLKRSLRTIVTWEQPFRNTIISLNWARSWGRARSRWDDWYGSLCPAQHTPENPRLKPAVKRGLVWCSVSRSLTLTAIQSGFPAQGGPGWLPEAEKALCCSNGHSFHQPGRPLISHGGVLRLPLLPCSSRLTLLETLLTFLCFRSLTFCLLLWRVLSPLLPFASPNCADTAVPQTEIESSVPLSEVDCSFELCRFGNPYFL